jgi:hypothetical protein
MSNVHHGAVPWQAGLPPGGCSDGGGGGTTRTAGVTDRPQALELAVLGIPSELKELPQWVLWRYDRKDDDWSKVPYQPDGRRKAKANDPGTWGGFPEVMSRYRSERGNWSGVGYFFAESDPYCGVDLDDCRDPDTGEVSAEAKELIRALETYAEVSPSGTGVKLILRGRRPGDKSVFPVGLPGLGKVEVYSQGRYFAMTGHRLPGATAQIADRQAALDRLYRCGFRPGEPEAPPASVDEQLERLEREFASHATHGPMGVEERAIRYLDRCPPAVSGEGGHATTFAVARAIVYGFDLGPDRGFALLGSHYNPRCRPPWSDRDLRHKCDEADRKTFSKPRGYLLGQPRPYVARWPSSSSRRDSSNPEPWPDPVGEAHLTDRGNGIRLATWHGPDLRHVHAWKRWLVWDGRRWTIDDTGEIDRRAKAVTVQMFAEAVEETRQVQRDLEGGEA